jgi:hypothetical protein
LQVPQEQPLFRASNVPRVQGQEAAVTAEVDVTGVVEGGLTGQGQAPDDLIVGRPAEDEEMPVVALDVGVMLQPGVKAVAAGPFEYRVLAAILLLIRLEVGGRQADDGQVAQPQGLVGGELARFAQLGDGTPDRLQSGEALPFLPRQRGETGLGQERLDEGVGLLLVRRGGLAVRLDGRVAVPA